MGMQAIRAQGASSAPAFYIADFELIDRDGIRPYSAGVKSTFAPFGGKYIVRGGEVAALEGEPPKGRLVVIGLPAALSTGCSSPASRTGRPSAMARRRSSRCNSTRGVSNAAINRRGEQIVPG